MITINQQRQESQQTTRGINMKKIIPEIIIIKLTKNGKMENKILKASRER